MKWEDLDLDSGTVTVRRTLRRVKGRGLVPGPPKTKNARRSIELSGATVALLKGHRSGQAGHRLLLGPAWEDQRLVFPAAGRPWWPENFAHEFKRLVRASGVDDPDTVTVHTLRHTGATHWIRAGANLFAVSRRLGHASAAFTMDTCGHMLPGMQRAAAGALDHMLAEGSRRTHQRSDGPNIAPNAHPL